MQPPSTEFFYLLIAILLICLICLLVFPTVAVERGGGQMLAIPTGAARVLYSAAGVSAEGMSSTGLSAGACSVGVSGSSKLLRSASE